MDELTNISMVMATPWWEILELSDIVAHLLFPKSSEPKADITWEFL